MNNVAHYVRQARQNDAADIAHVYIDSWHDTYPGVLPTALLRAMTPKGQTARWLATIQAQGRETVLVAEMERAGVVGMASLGPIRDDQLGFDGEVYTLYVDPAFYGQGIGRALLKGAFAAMRKGGMTSCVIWAHAHNHARYFYEAMGGRLIAERTTRLMGEPMPEAAFGWKSLALAERSPAR
jgi:GNAT superfamily N-acetyltransferase